MAKNKISEWSATPANNTDIGGIDIAEGCAPSGINNAIRELMAQVKDMQTGADGDSLTIAGTLVASGTLDVTGGFLLDGSAGTSGQVMISAGSGNTPTWGTSVPSGVIVLWSGSIASIPSGWYLCNGSNGTPDLRDRFIVGAGSTYSVNDTGGAVTATSSSSGGSATSSSSVVVATTGWGTTGSAPGTLTSGRLVVGSGFGESGETLESIRMAGNDLTTGSHSHTAPSHTHTVDTRSPYFALAYIMKA